MPNEQTQQEWLKKFLIQSRLAVHMGEFQSIVSEIISAWPSSPQGIVAKQVMELWQRWLDMPFYEERDAYEKYIVPFKEEVLQAVDAARKAGVTT